MGLESSGIYILSRSFKLKNVLLLLSSHPVQAAILHTCIRRAVIYENVNVTKQGGGISVPRRHKPAWQTKNCSKSSIKLWR